MIRQSKSTTDKFTKTLHELVKRPENKTCADCKRNDPRWASWNIGVFLCIRCSGIHRGMGTHISKVKSVDLDVWTPEQMESIQKWGNRLANLYWEAHLKPGHFPPDHKMESFIRSKYESRRWALGEPPPSDPSTLDRSTPTPENQVPQSPPRAKTTPPEVKATASRQRPSAPWLKPGSSQPAPPAMTEPQADLLSTKFFDQPQDSTKNEIQKASHPQEPTTDLLSLDFHASPAQPILSQASNLSPDGMKDVKQEILSFFAAPGRSTAISANVNQPQSTSIPDVVSPWGGAQPSQPFVPTSMIGNNGTAAWGVASGWNPLHSNVSSAHQQQYGLFNTGDIWGSSGATKGASQELFNVTFNSAPVKETTDDPFGDLWGGFK